MEEVKKGPTIRCGGFELIPIEKWTREEFERGSLRFCYWTKEPLGVQVLGSDECYALDLEGRPAPELLDL